MVCATGAETRGKFGVDYRFDVALDGVDYSLYLPMPALVAVQRAGVQDGDTVEIVKNKREGQQETWSVRRVEWNAQPHGVAVMPQPRPALPARQPAVQPYPRQSAPPAQQPKPLGTEDILTRCITTAIDAAVIGEKHAHAKGMTDLAFTSEDIRAMALSIYINKSRERAA